jgi:hypothetical protein
MPLRRLERLLATSPRCLLSRSSGYFENIGLKSSPAKSSSPGDSSFGRAHQSGASAARFSQPGCNFEFAARVRPTELPRACQGDEWRKSRRRFRSCIANGAMDGRSVCCGRVDEFCAGARRLVGGACGNNAVRGCKMAQAGDRHSAARGDDGLGLAPSGRHAAFGLRPNRLADAAFCQEIWRAIRSGAGATRCRHPAWPAHP